MMFCFKFSLSIRSSYGRLRRDHHMSNVKKPWLFTVFCGDYISQLFGDFS